MSDYYVSPYGFGPITDAVLDCVAERRGMSFDALEGVLGRIREEGEARGLEELDVWVESEWWNSHMGPAIDAMEDHLSQYLPEKE